jgi:hypothetical protein
LHTYKLEIEEITDVPASLSPTPLKAVLDIVEKMIKKR